MSTINGTILLTGGSGKTATCISSLLSAQGVLNIVASRRATNSATSAKFDWLDSTTYSAPFANGANITAVYIVAPDVTDPSTPINEFVDYAIKEHGVKRFVLMGGSSCEPGGRHVGGVWQHLLDIGVEYCVLRPTWFMANFSEPGWGHQKTIQSMSKLFTATGNGKIPFVSTEDIAAVAVRALIDEKSHDCDYRVLGSRLLTHDEVAGVLSRALGREVVHVKLSGEEREQGLVGVGLPTHYANFLTKLETDAAEGAEEREDDAVERVTGKKPVSFEEFVEKNKIMWE